MKNSKRGQRTDLAEPNLRDVFLDELADMHHAEKQLTKALPKMIKAAESETLRSAFETNLEETKSHLDRLEQAFSVLGGNVKCKVCKGMKGIIEEGEEILKEAKGTPALDATIICYSQKVEHYEIASYGTLVAWAKQFGNPKVTQLLQENLYEEKAADLILTEIAESLSNFKGVEGYIHPGTISRQGHASILTGIFSERI